ncbi:two-component regulator propeller domain-containing protein [Saccharicrinis sp. FJH54]|uniref:hybrid sensor histidine kinase/response regulator transcription factor n=1 Tax=Saccharicrinis sp. FJH54 TaxID=3344665 RepID=UPI0035D4B365
MRSFFITTFLCILQLTFSVGPKLYFDNITTENGLTDNYVNCILQDDEGWIWIGTGMGIQKFDGIKFKEYGIYINDSTLIKNFLIRNFLESNNHTIYGCIEDFGLVKYNKQKDIFERLKFNNTAVLADGSVKDLAEDNNGNLWAATKNGIYKIDFKRSESRHYAKDTLINGHSISDNYVRTLCLENDTILWIGTRKGLDKFNLKSQIITNYPRINPELEDEIFDITVDSSHRKWIGTGENGLIVIDNENPEGKRFPFRDNQDRSNTVRKILQSGDGHFWIGTRAGLYFYDEKVHKPELYQNNLLEEKSLVHNSVMNITKDRKGDLWIGTRGGLSYLSMEKQVFKTYKALPDHINYLNNSEIYCFSEDQNGKIWIGTEDGGVNILNVKTGRFSYLTRENNKISSNCIKAIRPFQNKILIGTFEGGLNMYNPASGKSTVYLHDEHNPQSISNNIVWDINIDQKNNIWIGTASGLDLFDPVNETFTHFPQFDDMINGVTWIGIDSDNDLWLGSEVIKIFKPGFGIYNTFKENSRGFYTDSENRNWVMTLNKGIIQYDKQKGPVKTYNENDGLSCNLTYCMLEDKAHNLWISTANGLSSFNPKEETFQNFYRIDGLQGDQFHYGASYKTKNGDLLFGGINGFNSFNPSDIKDNKFKPPVYVTDFKVFNRSFENKELLSDSTTEIKIPYDSKFLTFEFVALNYTNSSRNRYRYYLEGFDYDWSEPTENRSATYTNLDPGEYTFRVMAGNNKNTWNTSGAVLKLTIKPPFYKTAWFYISSSFALVVIIFLSFRYILKILELRKSLEYEKKEAQRLHELDAFKLQFFTNISHEIKTPLTLIVSPLEKIMHHNFKDPSIRENLDLMHRNARHLMELITQLLDYRKLESGMLKVNYKKGDIVQFSKDIFNSFTGLMNESELNYKFISIKEELITDFDPDKLKKILDNILSNAVRYNKRGGSISFIISAIINDDRNNLYQQYLQFVIKDTGTGIPRKNLGNVFNRFFSGDHENSTSSGIGLAFTKELVKLLHGDISVESEEGVGTTFTVLLPMKDDSITIEENSPAKVINVQHKPVYEESISEDRKIMLLVEDNADVRQFLTTHFEETFRVLEASNGSDGLEMAIQTIPDIIISDVMMPGINGDELCNKLKNDEKTSHIPIILLTALSSKESVMEGLMKGADDFISKPFDISILQTKVDNLLALREALKEKYSREMVLKPTSVNVQSPDEKFIQKALKIVEENIDNPDLDIEFFVKEMAISRMQLYRKLSALTNMTVKEFINDIRLKRSFQLLTESDLSVSEVAYACGFSDASYFGKCIRKKYNMSATEIKKTKGVQHE